MCCPGGTGRLPGGRRGGRTSTNKGDCILLYVDCRCVVHVHMPTCPPHAFVCVPCTNPIQSMLCLSHQVTSARPGRKGPGWWWWWGGRGSRAGEAQLSAPRHGTHQLHAPAPKCPCRGGVAPRWPQLWLVALYILIARASPAVRLGIVAAIALITATNFPERLWKSQLSRLAVMCGVIFFFTAIGADGIPPLLQASDAPPTPPPNGFRPSPRAQTCASSLLPTHLLYPARTVVRPGHPASKQASIKQLMGPSPGVARPSPLCRPAPPGLQPPALRCPLGPHCPCPKRPTHPFPTHPRTRPPPAAPRAARLP